MIELIISNVRVPLLSLSITLNKQVNNLAELKDRQATYTNKFKVAKTPNVLRLFNNLGVIGNTSRAPYIILKCKLIYNSIEVLRDGNAYITDGNDDYFSVTIYDGNIFLFQQIGSKDISKLDFSSYQHQLTPTNYINSYPRTSGYIYAVSDNGRFAPLNKIAINYQIPSIFINTVWDKIFEATDYTYEFVDFDRTKFDKLVITPKRGYNGEFDVVSNPFQIDQTSSFTKQGFKTSLIYSEGGNPAEDIWMFEWNINSITAEYVNEPALTNGIIHITESGQYRVRIDLTLTTLTEGSQLSFNISNEAGNTIYYEEFEDTTTTSYNVNTDLTLSLNAGATLKYSLNLKIEDEDYALPHPDITISTRFRVESVDTSVIDISLNTFIGDLTQKNFLKAIMQHFGFVIQPKLNTNIYQFKRIQDILLDTENAIDWSNKYVLTKKESYQLKGYAQLNRMAYNYFDDNADKVSDGFLEVDNKNLRIEKTMFTSPFNACDTSNTLLNGKAITLTPFWSAVRDKTGLITNYEPVDNKNYLAEVKRINETIDYGLQDGTAISYTGDVPRLDFSNLNYNNIITENYKQLKVVLDWNNVKQIEVRLTAKEVKEFDFYKLVYIEQLSSFFYVNKVSYNGRSVSKAEIVKVKKIPYECDLVANAGSYPDIEKTDDKLNLDGTASLGVITTWFWEIISQPAGGIATISDTSISNPILNDATVIGEYRLRLTISNTKCSSISETIITQLG